MCGILGAFAPQNDRARFEKALKLIHQRGPDAQGVYDKNEVLLGHKRLSILDLSDEAAQPMIRKDWVIVFNGEIFNFIEIKKDLELKGYQFKSKSDTEVVLAAYQEWGEEAFHRFNGMWAIALYNQASGELILSRDRFGIKPLYYYYEDNTLYFASEVKAFYPLLGDKARYNQKVIDSLIINKTFQYHGTEQSYLDGVYSLGNGCNLKYDKNGIQTYQWYQLKKRPVPEKFEDRVNELRELLLSACKLRLRSDVPLATSLSGGLDSSTVAAIISSGKLDLDERFLSEERYQGFCASFPNSPIDESEKAQSMADSVDLKLNVIDVNNPSIDELSHIMELYDGPSNTLAFYPIAKLYKEIKRKGITVSLDGQGPDEMLAGYWPVKEAMQAAFDAKDFKWFSEIYSAYVARSNRAYFDKNRIRSIANDVIWKDAIRKLFKGGKQEPNNAWVYPEQAIPQGEDALESKLLEQFFHNPLPGILNQYDRCSMISSVECRMPFMDYRVVEFLFSIPSRDKVNNGYTKYILREAADGFVPDNIRLEKVKYGFNAPILDWFNQGLGEWMGEVFNTQEFKENPFFDGQTVADNFNVFQKSKSQNWEEAWAFWAPFHIYWWSNYSKELMK